jgi:signal transduction histidine kinase
MPCLPLRTGFVFLVALFVASAFALADTPPANVVIKIDDLPVQIPASNTVSISPTAHRIGVELGYPRSSQLASRIRFKLDGVDEGWREGNGDMEVAFRFFDASGDQIGQRSFSVSGKSAGWTGRLEKSTFTHRRETLIVPPNATSLWAVLSSAGPPETLGQFTIEGLSVSRPSPDHSPEVILHLPSSHEASASPDAPPPGWTVDGIRRSMAKVSHFGEAAQSEGLSIIDDDPNAHAEWHTTRQAAPRITPGEQLLVEWNEVFSIGLAARIEISYPVPPSGNWPFHISRLDVFGNPVGTESVIYFNVPPPLWKRSWFWVAITVLAAAALLAINRYVVHRKIREELLLLRQERMLAQERLRIARDIHDDLGARATHISLVSARAEENASSTEKARASFEQISALTRDLVFSLYQIVWAVNPENDNLEALANHLCQISSKLCESANLPCRLHVSELPPRFPVSSDVRHHVSMTVCESINNAIKHAKASELGLSLSFENSILAVSIRDDGQGFQLNSAHTGNGLSNMQHRIEELGGAVSIESEPSKGTIVRVTLPLHPQTRPLGAN